MSRIIHAFLASALIAAPVHIVSAQTGSRTFSFSGVMNGQPYTSVTLHYNSGQITYHFTDGSQYTVATVDPAVFAEFDRVLKRREANPR